MPSLRTVVKGMCSGMAIPGAVYILMGAGAIPLDKQVAAAAEVFVGPLGIPVETFLLVLGPCKILGVASLWGYGPMPPLLGHLGLMTSAFCGGIGHYVQGDPVVPAAIGFAMLSSLFFLKDPEESSTVGDDKKKE